MLSELFRELYSRLGNKGQERVEKHISGLMYSDKMTRDEALDRFLPESVSEAIDALIEERIASALTPAPAPVYAATGAEIKKFYFDGWPEDFYHDDSEIETQDDHGNWILKPDEVYNLDRLGMLIANSGSHKENMTFTEAFLKWKANQ